MSISICQIVIFFKFLISYTTIFSKAHVCYDSICCEYILLLLLLLSIILLLLLLLLLLLRVTFTLYKASSLNLKII